MTDVDWSRLEAAWRPARAAGVIGSAPLSTLVDHAAGFVPAAWRVEMRTAEIQGVDLGTGAGVPGLLLAALLPRSRWLLVDASERRLAMTRGAVRALGVEDRVELRHARAEDVAHDPSQRSAADLVVARLFGDAAEVAECGGPLVATDGMLVVSVTEESAERWEGVPAEVLAMAGLGAVESWSSPSGRYVGLPGLGHADPRMPRRPPARRRAPLF